MGESRPEHPALDGGVYLSMSLLGSLAKRPPITTALEPRGVVFYIVRDERGVRVERKAA